MMHELIGYDTSLAVSDMAFCKQIVFVRLKMSAVGGSGLPRPPLLW
jgi:hypothetical protein